MEKLITDALVVISLTLGIGFSARTLHDKARGLAIEALMQKSPSLSSFTAKLTRK